MAVPPRYNLKIYQGSDWDLSLQVLDANDTPRDLTGYTAGFAIRNRPGQPEAHIDLTDGSGITITPATGTIEVALSASETAEFQFSWAVYDLYIVSSAGTVTYILMGDVELISRVAIPTS